MDDALIRIRDQAVKQAIRVTQHAQEEMDEEEIMLNGCGGEYEPREVVHTIHQGNRIIVIDHVPAEVCTICGDVLFTPETVRKIELLRHTAALPTRTVPLYDFTEVKSA